MSTPHLILTQRFGDAVAYTARLHADQTRKDSTIPYVAHLLGAAAFVIEQEGATEDQAIAGLLHDAIEDQPDKVSLADIAERWGQPVADIVRDCTDAEEVPKRPWRHRKVDYLAHLAQAPDASLMVSLADKLHNARAILSDMAAVGADVWMRFTAPPVAQRWYYTSLVDVIGGRLGDRPHVLALRATVRQICGPIAAGVPLDDRGRPDWVGPDALTGALAEPEEMRRGQSSAAPVAVRDGAWATDDGRWWLERVPTGDPSRPLGLFVKPS